MNFISRISHGFRGAKRLWIECLLLCFVHQALGDAVQDTYRYQVTLDGMGQLQFKFPVFDNDGGNADKWADATIYIQPGGGSKTTLLQYTGIRTGNDNGKPNVTISRGVDGTMVLRRAQDYSDVNITAAPQTVVLPSEAGQTYSLADIVWNVPRAYRGKRVTISWSVTRYVEKSSTHSTVSISSTEMDIPAAPAELDPMVMQPILAFETSHSGQIMIPWMIGAAEVVKAQIVYNDKTLGKTVTDTLVSETSGMAYVPANHVIDGLYVEVDYKDSEGTLVTGRKSSPAVSVPMLHTARKFTATLLTDGRARLDWQIGNVEWEDIMDGDQWEIQRNITGSVDRKDENWETVGIESFDRTQETYQFIDESLPASYATTPVSYRLRRLATAGWDWSDDSGLSLTYVSQLMYLPVVATASVVTAPDWGENNLHKVVLNWTMTPNSDNLGDSNFYIRTAGDWETFAMMVNSGNTDMQASLQADITLDASASMIGDSESYPFSGTFDGNGHTLTVSFKDVARDFVAPFSYIYGATIRNLCVKGSVEGRQHPAGLIGRSNALSENLVENCRVSADIYCNALNPHAGGFVGHNGSAKTVVRYSLFDGTVTARTSNNDSYVGAFIGWEDGNTHNEVYNNLENGKYNAFRYSAPNYHYSYGGGTAYGNNSTNHDNYTRSGNFSDRLFNASGMDAATLTDKLGATQWQAVGDEVLPRMANTAAKDSTIFVWDDKARLVLYIDKYVGGELRYTETYDITDEERRNGQATVALTTSCVEHGFRLCIDKSASRLHFLEMGSLTTMYYEVNRPAEGASSFYFDNNVRMDSIYYEEKQTSVVLHWTTSGGNADYYRISRRDLMADTAVILEAEYKQQAYADNTVRPQHNYEYVVEGVTSCEGDHVSSISIVAHCVPTGLVRGYVRLVDGTALANRIVTATPVEGTGTEGASAVSAETDANGFFEIKGLAYVMRGMYELTVATLGDEDPFTPITVEFNDETNMAVNLIFTQSDYCKFSGTVFYEGSSIPVVGARFMRDGKPVRNASGNDVVTNSMGQFTVSIPRGTHSVQVVKDGHRFLNDGYYLNAEGSKDVNWQESVAGVYLWDQTKVRLRGRVAGGHIQGDKPLGQSLSRNNLGNGITIVMQLEGDNSSWIVRDQLDANVKERHETFRHGAADPATGEPRDLTRMDSYRQRIVLYPDSLTGEYEALVYPVKYKVTEIYASGYSTLFQSGMVAETLDLTNYGNDETATYSRIYHSVPRLRYRQLNMLGEDYLGLKQYIAMDVAGQRDTIQLWSPDGGYAMGYPVYMAQNPVIMSFSAREEYYFNNNTDTVPDVVPLDNCKVIMQNGLVSTTDNYTLQLDGEGEGTYTFTPDNVTAVQSGENALRSLTMTLFNDSTYYNQTALQAFVMAAVAKRGGKKAVASGGTYLLDILRDPPGSGSSAYIENGSKMTYSFKCDWSAKAGVNLSLTNGTNANYYIGAWGGLGAGPTSGNINLASSSTLVNTSIVANYNGTWNYSYDFATTERIQTSSGPKNIGPVADLYIGLTQNVIAEEATAVRVVSSAMYRLLSPREGGKVKVDDHEYNVKSGMVEVLATGYDAVRKDTVYLIRDEVMSMSTELTSTFVHSQGYILDELIPDLLRQRSALMLPMGTSTEVALQAANRSGKPVYISKVPETDDSYCLTGADGKPAYTIVYPQQDGHDVVSEDEINRINQEILTWAGFIEKNEKEKLEANDLVKSYDFDGRANLQYSETFTTNTTESRYMKLPFVDGLSGTIQGFEALSKLIAKAGETNKYTYSDDAGLNFTGVDVQVFGYKLQLKFAIVLGFDYNYAYGQTKTYSKKTGFTLACGNKSSLVVDVYRTKSDYERLKQLSEGELKKKVESGEIVIFPLLEDNARDAVDNGRMNKSNAMTSWLSYFKSSTPEYRNLVYRTRAGVTAAPYEGPRVTQFYRPGTVLDEGTVAIDNLRIWTNNASVSNVPFDEPARYKLFMANETLYPDRATLIFTYALDTKSNPKGAKVSIDGNMLNGTGYTVNIPAGQTVVKEVEIQAGDDFDYDDIGIFIFDPNDPTRISTQKLSAHFVPSAGKVNISLPGDKWVVNTESEYDTDRQDYFLPVQIDGFNVNFRNFDHIELQYKLSTQGDKNWVNVCSYYNDRQLMEQASGERDTISNAGIIQAMFYGEASPIEQEYDLRAVVYCRYGNGYLSSSSNILSGIKDTRRPQLFGTPMPNNGVLDIGDDIKLRFSEQIAGNYLREANNFQVLGQTNSTNIALSTCLRFNGNGAALANAYHNLGSESFTVDVMLNPDPTGRTMTVFSHGDKRNSLELGVTADNRLTAAFGDTVFVSESSIAFNNALHQVQYLFEADVEAKTTHVAFYDGSLNIGSFTYNHLYNGAGNLQLGVNKLGNIPGSTNYEGEMLEFRLWNRALTAGEMASYSQKILTGYELGLLDNYGMNEGEGQYSYNRVTSGSDLQVGSQAWKRPDGIGMRLDGTEGFRISSDKLVRAPWQDYTLMFWFRTTDTEGTLLANGPAESEVDYTNHFNFGVREGRLDLRLGGMKVSTDTEVSDGSWHHAVLTVNRSRNVGNLYVDDRLKNSFPVDTIGGLGLGMYAGVTYVDATTRIRPIRGHIDEIALYEMVLPENIIKNYGNVTPSGDEMGILAYLNFSQNELQGDNTQRLMPTGISLKRYTDPVTGKYTAQRDTIIAQDVVDRLADRESYAPMRQISSLENIPFSFVADGKDLLITLDVPDNKIEKTHVMVSVKEVSDLNGNLMASPVNMNLYVYRNPLRWTDKRLDIDMEYGKGATFQATVSNLSGQTRSFTVEGLPLWVSASQTAGIVSPLDEQTLTFTISPYINIGDYDEVIYLMGEHGMAEPLPLNISVRGDSPLWAVNDTIIGKNIAMHLIARVEVDGNVADDPDDILAVYGPNHKLFGVANIDVDNSNNANEALVFVTIYNRDYEATPLDFRFFDASSGRIYVLRPESGTITFKADAVMGSTAAPVVLRDVENQEVQSISLNPGWNWVSFYVQPETSTVTELLNNTTRWHVGDAIEILNDGSAARLISFKASEQGGVWDQGDTELQINPGMMYRFYTQFTTTLYMVGEPANSPITIHGGWNRIGYMSSLNLPVVTALADYSGRGSEGDIIKSQSEFAVLSLDASGVPTWKGTLKYLCTGEGYMLRHQGDDVISFSYPSYSGNTRYASDARRAPLMRNNAATSMNMIAAVEGVEPEEGDVIVAYMGAEKCGMAEADEEGRFFLNVGRGEQDQVTFTLEREGEIVAVASTAVHYAADAVMGSLDKPTVISFVRWDNPGDGNWYTVQGIRLNGRPTQPGVYIHNGKKTVW